MKRALKGIPIALLFAVSCQTIVFDFENGRPAEAPAQKQTQASLFMGIKELSDPVAVSCPKGPSKIVIRRTPVDFIVHFLIGGVYTIRTAEVYCPQ